jgi:hypothetical protein
MKNINETDRKNETSFGRSARKGRTEQNDVKKPVLRINHFSDQGLFGRNLFPFKYSTGLIQQSS